MGEAWPAEPVIGRSWGRIKNLTVLRMGRAWREKKSCRNKKKKKKKKKGEIISDQGDLGRGKMIAWQGFERLFGISASWDRGHIPRSYPSEQRQRVALFGWKVVVGGEGVGPG